MTTNKKSLVLLGLLSLVWGSYFMLIEMADDFFPPLVIATMRMLFGAGLLLVVLKAQGLRLPPPGRAWAPFVVIGLFEALVPTALLSLGETHISSGLASVLFSTMPVLTVLIGYVWLSRPLTRNKIIGVVVGFAGIIIVLIPDLSVGAGEGLLLIGVTAVFLASLSKAFAALYSHQVMAGLEPVVVATTMMLSAAVVGLPFMLVFEDLSQVQFSGEGLLVMGLIGLNSAVGFLIFFWLIKHRGPTFASLVRFNEPPVAILLAAIISGETVQMTTLIGMAVVLLCIAIINGYLDGFFAKVVPARRSAYGR